jgi:hypothetical protein
MNQPKLAIDRCGFCMGALTKGKRGNRISRRDILKNMGAVMIASQLPGQAVSQGGWDRARRIIGARLSP